MLKDGIVFAIIMMAVFGALDLFIINSNIADGSRSGFPLEYSTSYTGLCPQGKYPCGGTYSNNINLAIDISIPILIGFGISYLKNRAGK